MEGTSQSSDEKKRWQVLAVPMSFFGRRVIFVISVLFISNFLIQVAI